MLVRLPKLYPGRAFPAELSAVGAPPFADRRNSEYVLRVSMDDGRSVTIDPPGGPGCELIEATAGERDQLRRAGFDLPDSREVADSHYDRGCELLATGRPAEAVEAFTRATELKPDDAGAFYNRGYAHAVLLRRAGWQRIETGGGAVVFAGDEQALDAIERATADFTRAVELDPHKAAALGMRAQMYWLAGRIELAEADTRAAAALGDAAAAESLRTRFGRGGS